MLKTTLKFVIISIYLLYLFCWTLRLSKQQRLMENLSFTHSKSKYFVAELSFILSSIYIRRKYWTIGKFSTSGFRWIYMFWDVLNMNWPFLENVCRSVCLYYFVDSVSQELMCGNWWKLIFSCTFMGLRAD